MVSTNEHASPPGHAATTAGDLDLPFFDYSEPGLVRRRGVLVRGHHS